MKNKITDPINGEEVDYTEQLTDVQTKNRIEQHMSNINDKITEEDMQNIRTDMYDELLRNDHEEKKTTDSGTIAMEKERIESEKINSVWNTLED